jgi:hypothetical protein
MPIDAQLDRTKNFISQQMKTFILRIGDRHGNRPVFQEIKKQPI